MKGKKAKAQSKPLRDGKAAAKQSIPAANPSAPGGTPASESAPTPDSKMHTDKNCRFEAWLAELTDSDGDGTGTRSRRGREKKPRAVEGINPLSTDFQDRLKWGEFAAEFGKLIFRRPFVPCPVTPHEEQETELRAQRAEVRSHTEARGKFAQHCLDALEEGDAGFFAKVASELRRLEESYYSRDRSEHLRDREGLAVSYAVEDCKGRGEAVTNTNVRHAMSREPLKTFLRKLGIESPLDRKNIKRIAERLGIPLAAVKAGRPKNADKK